ncbi:MAG: hypothetical protein F6K17_43280 [Okeania sp. SIO3C4]|nr:hypothetical protein [Okeania sp. SIO3B3]NER08865.1 hypothetical protein [Okeania sp. SIO3C4]
MVTKKREFDHVEEMILNVVNKKKLSFKTVLMDSWYAPLKICSDRSIYHTLYIVSLRKS